jgi:hypothetical protein
MQDDELLSLYGRLSLLEEWIWARLLETPRSLSQWERLQQDYDRLAEDPQEMPAQNTAQATEASGQQLAASLQGPPDHLRAPHSLATAGEDKDGPR